MISRRGVLAGLAALFGKAVLPAAPQPWVGLTIHGVEFIPDEVGVLVVTKVDYGDLVEITRKAMMPRLYEQAIKWTPLLEDIVAKDSL